jgi:hypothetical protein
VEVTTTTAFEGRKSLKVVSAGNTSSDYDLVGVKFCVQCEASVRFKASFAVRFDSFINWNGIAVTNSPVFAYWWWVRHNGTIFDDTTFSQFTPGKWHQVEIDVDRDAGLATIAIDGVVHQVGLVPTWPEPSHDQPMGCLRIMALEHTNQTLYLDNIEVHAIK